MKLEQIAQFNLGAWDIPETTLEMAATLLIDTVGVAAGAADMDAGRIARAHAFAYHGTGDPAHAAPMMFDGRRVSVPGAAFAVATQIDNLDAHDGYNPTKGHISCALVPALFAFAASHPDLSGRDALAAYVLSYETAARAAIALHATVSDYHTSGAWNALGVAALACRLLGADADQFRQALGVAEYHGPRSQMMREIANPTMLHDGSGMGALVGSMAALMARDGFTGAPALTVEDPAVAHIWDDLGTLWTTELSYIKPYPICRWAHAALDALAGLIAAHAFDTADLKGIRVNTFAESAALFPAMPQTTSQAQYSLQFALATLLRHGRIAPEHISGEALRDPEIEMLLPLFSVHEAPRHSKRFPIGRWSDVTVTMKDGTEHCSGDVHARGGPEAPMALDEVEAKFHTMARVLPDARRTAIWAMRDRLLQKDAKFSELSALVNPAIEGANA